MSDNKSQQGRYEAQCMEALRRSMFTKPYRDFGDMCDACASHGGLIVDDAYRDVHYFGMTAPQSHIFGQPVYDGDVYGFERLIATVMPQSGGTVFPDFLSPVGGFVEHFVVTAASDTRDGAGDKIDNANVQREIARRQAAVDEYAASVYDGRLQYYDVSFSTPFVFMSHDNFVKSFKKHWEKHIDSLKKSDYLQSYPRVFLVDACSNLLCMHERIRPAFDVRTRFYCGLLQYRGAYEGPYSLARDVVLLKYLRDFADCVDFVIFMGGQGLIEVIKLSYIDNMLPLLGCQMQIVSLMGQNFHSVQSFIVPDMFDLESEEKDK